MPVEVQTVYLWGLLKEKPKKMDGLAIEPLEFVDHPKYGFPDLKCITMIKDEDTVWVTTTQKLFHDPRNEEPPGLRLRTREINDANIRSKYTKLGKQKRYSWRPFSIDDLVEEIYGSHL